jgi:hypothetical protein
VTVGTDLSIFGRAEAGKLIDSAQPFARAATVLRAATAIVERRPLRHSRMSARLLEAANRAQDEELRLISQDLRHSVKVLRSATAESDSQGWPPR